MSERFIGGTLESIGKAAESVGGGLKSTGEGAGSLVSGAGAFVKNTGEGAGHIISNTGNVVEKTGQGLLNTLEGAGKGTKHVLSGAGEVVQITVKSAVDLTRGAVDVVGHAGNKMTHGLPPFTNALGDTLKRAAAIPGEMLGGFLAAFRKIPHTIRSAASPANAAKITAGAKSAKTLAVPAAREAVVATGAAMGFAGALTPAMNVSAVEKLTSKMPKNKSKWLVISGITAATITLGAILFMNKKQSFAEREDNAREQKNPSAEAAPAR